MTKRSIVFLPIRLLLVTALLIAALPALFVQSAFAERVEGPLRADPRAYEHVDDDVLYAQGEGGFADGDMIAQAQGGSNIVNLGITLDQMIRMCMANDQYGNSYARFKAALDPNNCDLTVFADLRTSSGLTAAQIDAFILSTAKGRPRQACRHGFGLCSSRADIPYQRSVSRGSCDSRDWLGHFYSCHGSESPGDHLL